MRNADHEGSYESFFVLVSLFSYKDVDWFLYRFSESTCQIHDVKNLTGLGTYGDFYVALY